jgi:hypothetical protein
MKSWLYPPRETEMSVLTDEQLESLRKKLAARRWKVSNAFDTNGPGINISDDEICGLFDTIDHLRQERAVTPIAERRARAEEWAKETGKPQGSHKYSEAYICGYFGHSPSRSDPLTSDIIEQFEKVSQERADAVQAGLATYPRPCGLCPGQIESSDDLGWHGLGNCVPICEHCLGSGIEPKARQIRGAK